jgi:hypothetical protein
VRAFLDRAGRRWPLARGRTAVITGSAATAAVVGAIAVLVMVLPQATHQGRTVLGSPGAAGTGGRPTATVTPATGKPTRTGPGASSSAAGSLAQQHASRPARPAPAGNRTPGAAAGDAPGAAAAGGGSTTPASGPATSAPAPTVTVIPGTLVLAGLLGSATGTLTLSAGSAPVTHYTVSIPSSLAGQLTASPASGSIPAHGSQRVTVTLTGLLSVDSTITVDPGGHPVTVLLGVHLGG